MTHRNPSIPFIGRLALALTLTAGRAWAAAAVMPNGGTSPVWSPDGRWVAFLSRTPNTPANVWVTGVEGRPAPRRLTRLGGRCLGWAADSRAVHCQTMRGGSSAFDAIDVEEGREERLLSFLASDVVAAAWSRDMAQVAYLQRHGDHRDLWAAETSGANPRRLTEGLPVRAFVWSPDGREIAFDLAPTAGGGVLVVPAAGGTEPKLVFGEMGSDPSWSPDSGSLAIVGMHALTVVSRDGTKSRRLHVSQSDVTRVDWSPDGKRLAYSAADPGKQGIATVEVDTGAVTHLTVGWEYAGSPRWSPDGQRIAFEGRRPGDAGTGLRLLDVARRRVRALATARPCYWAGRDAGNGRLLLYRTNATDGGQFGLCLARPGSGRPKALLKINPRAPEQVSWPAGLPRGTTVIADQIWEVLPDAPARLLLKTEHPTWADLSPQGEMLAYVKWREHRSSIVLRRMADGGETELVPPPEGGVGYSRLAWSPDGKSVAYVRGGTLLTTNRDGRATVLFEVPRSDQPAVLLTPAWSPDGRWVAVGVFTRRDEQKLRVLLIDSETQAVQVAAQCLVVAEPGSLADPLGAPPAWSPDSRQLAYVIEEDGSPALCVAAIDASGVQGSPRRLRREAAYPTWRSDGRSLLVTALDGEGERLVVLEAAGGAERAVRLGLARPYATAPAGAHR